MTSTDLSPSTVLAAEHLNLRRLPPVEPVERPRRFSQTLLRHADSCKRSAYLYVRHHGGMPSHVLDRGTALHIAQAKATNLILERHLLDGGAGDVDYSVDEHTAKLLLDETLAENPDLTIPLHERDQLRIMMSHLANGWRINPEHVVAVERKFLIDLGEHTASCVLDLAMIDGTLGVVRDYKTEWAMPSQGDYEATFQGRLYAVALMFGEPVTEVPCTQCSLVYEGMDPRPDCPECDGRGHLDRREPCLGAHLTAIDVGEVFPRFLQDDGDVPVRSMPLARIEVEAIRRDIEQQCDALAAAFESSEFPAVSGSHCQRCPCEAECPLPRHLRNFAGAIQTEDEAREAMEWHARVEGKVSATRDEVKSFCKVHGPLRFGADQVAEFGESNRWETNWKAIEDGALRAANYGEPFDMSEHRRQTLRTQFRTRTLTDAELAAEREASQ